jgi:hypothetical protein
MIFLVFLDVLGFELTERGGEDRRVSRMDT